LTAIAEDLPMTIVASTRADRARLRSTAAYADLRARRPRRVTPEEYALYRLTPHWESTRLGALARAGHRCEYERAGVRCGGGRPSWTRSGAGSPTTARSWRACGPAAPPTTT
jgi:hypothetical protein